MKIVLVDDSDRVREQVKHSLAELPRIEIVGEAADVGEALHVVQAQKPDVAVLDIQLPGGSGLDVLREIKRTQPKTVVIMLTNYATPQYRNTCLSAGADYFFDKFSEQDRLMAVIEDLAQKLSQGQP